MSFTVQQLPKIHALSRSATYYLRSMFMRTRLANATQHHAHLLPTYVCMCEAFLRIRNSSIILLSFICMAKNAWQKLTQKFTMHIQTDSGLLAFLFVVPLGGVRRATCLCLDCTKSMHTDWNIYVNVSLVIHVNLDHAWAEHYPVTLMLVHI